jgi:hypothetical protein
MPYSTIKWGALRLPIGVDSESAVVTVVDIVAGTELGSGPGHVAMAVDYRIGIDLEELTNQVVHGALLRIGTGITRCAIGPKSAFVADADAVVVVWTTVGTDLINPTMFCF